MNFEKVNKFMLDNFGDVLDGVIDKLKQIMNPEQIKKEMYNQVEKEHRGKASEITPTAMPHDYDIQFITEKLTNSNAGKSVYGPGMPQTSPYGYTDATTGKSVYYGSNVWRGPQETEKKEAFKFDPLYKSARNQRRRNDGKHHLKRGKKFMRDGFSVGNVRLGANPLKAQEIQSAN